MIKIKFFFLFFILFFFKTETTEKQLSSDDIKNIATEIFNQYIETIKKIRAAKPGSNTKDILTNGFIFLIAPAFSMWIGYKAIDINFSDLIRNIFTRKNTLKIDTSKQNSTLPHYLEGIKFDNQQDKFFLFYGPPGTGKTFGASVLAANHNCFLKETDGNIFNVESFIGTDITKINNFFETLKKLSLKNPNQKIVALIDEFESIGSRDRTDHNSASTVQNAVNLMLTKMDTIKRDYPNIYIIFTTNYREKIDNALLTRCTVQIPFELPSIEMIEEILQTNFNEINKINEINENENNYIKLIKNNINEKKTEKKNLSINNLILEAANYDKETYDFWFGSLDLEIEKTNIELQHQEIISREHKKKFSLRKKKILTTYKEKLNAEKNFYQFFAVIAHLHQFNLRDINSFIEKKQEVQSQDHFIKFFSNKIVSKGFINKKISKQDKEKIINNLLEISNEALTNKIDALEKHLVYS